MFHSPTNADDYKSDEKVHILPKRYFSEYLFTTFLKYNIKIF